MSHYFGELQSCRPWRRRGAIIPTCLLALRLCRVKLVSLRHCSRALGLVWGGQNRRTGDHRRDRAVGIHGATTLALHAGEGSPLVLLHHSITDKRLRLDTPSELCNRSTVDRGRGAQRPRQ